MNLTEQLKVKNAALLAIYNKAQLENRGLTDEEKTLENTLTAEKTAIENQIANQKKLDEISAQQKLLDTPIDNFAQPKSNEGIKVFKNFAEQLGAVKNAAQGVRDERLDRLNTEYKNALGGNEGVGADGGFAVQTDFASEMLESAAKAGNILSRVDQYEISAGANGVKWVDVDETSVATTVFGGVQVYWAAEANAVTASKPKLTEKELKLEKLMGLAYASYELENDSTFTSNLYTKAFTKAIQRTGEGSLIGGDGVGKPIGILNSGSLVSVTKKAGQTADTLVWDNIVSMYNRALGMDDMSKYVWLCHPDVSEQLDFLSFPVGTGGVPVYLPASQQGAITTLKGLPVIPTDHCSALGDKGDIILANLNDYMMIMKGGVQTDMSMHVQFLTAENAFRFIFRMNGMPKKNTATTIKNSSKTRSSFITLDARA